MVILQSKSGYPSSNYPSHWVNQDKFPKVNEKILLDFVYFSANLSVFETKQSLNTLQNRK